MAPEVQCRVYIAVSLGTVPDGGVLTGTPTFGSGETHTVDKEDSEMSAARVAKQTSSLMAILSSHDLVSAPAKATRVWLGDGLGSISKRTHDKLMRWEFVDLGEFRPRTSLDRGAQDTETEKLVVLPGFEVAQAKKRPITNIITWVQCFSKYTAAVAQKYPECTPGFMSHMLVVLKAFGEVEEPGWCLYDEAFREKMASMGLKQWPGVDVQVYQETCGGFPRKRTERPTEPRMAGSSGIKRPTGGPKQTVCWQYNDGSCSYGRQCKFPHVCEVCRGAHPKSHCPSATGAGKRQRFN